MSQKYQTLHAHTTASDGVLDHKDVLDCCRDSNIGVVAFTDHDGLPSKESLKILEENRNQATKWIIGIEISSGLPDEMGGGVSSGLHIVGLFVDPMNSALRQHCKLAQESRVVRMQKMVKNLRNLGIVISEEDCLQESGGEAVGRPHIVAAIRKRKENLDLIESLRKQMHIAAMNDIDLLDKYEHMMRLGEQQYPYALFLGDEAFIPNVYVEYQYWTSMEKSIELIRNAGGIAIMAHYFTIRNKIPVEKMDKYLQQGKFDGIETLFGFHAYGKESEKDIIAEREIATQLALKNNVLQSGGADAHTVEDFVEFGRNKKYAEDSIGMAEKIIASGKVDTHWSSL
jgi:3',5'-nucleoside bisphosphate phosphatase